MNGRLTRLWHGLALGVLVSAAAAVPAAAGTPQENYATTKTYFDSLVGSGTPKTAELALFCSRMPKGGDIHLHYSGAIYAEQYLDRVVAEGLCVYRNNFKAGPSPYQPGEIEPAAFAREYEGGILVINDALKKYRIDVKALPFDAAQQAEFYRACNELIDQPALFRSIGEDKFTLEPGNAALLHTIKGTLASGGSPDIVQVRELNRSILRALYPRTFKNSYAIATAGEVRQDAALYRSVLEHWSVKDFSNHCHTQPPPDVRFFDTFGYFGAVSGSQMDAGLRTLKSRAAAENVQYLETMLMSSPRIAADDRVFDENVRRLSAQGDEKGLASAFTVFISSLARNVSLKNDTVRYVQSVRNASANIDDEHFTMRYQAVVSRNNSPSAVFSGLYTAFQAASRDPLLIAGVNILGPENGVVSMQDYGLHMRMIGLLKRMFPGVRVSLHAGELALGMVPPEGLQSHINDAVMIARADRIGHGVDIPYEENALAVLGYMREHGIPVEINLTSNEFILGVKGEAHPLTLYLKRGVPVVLSSDDPGVLRSSLSSEYVLLAGRYRLSYDVIKETVYNSIRYSFMDPEAKRKNLRELDARFAAFEADIAGFAAPEKTGK